MQDVTMRDNIDHDDKPLPQNAMQIKENGTPLSDGAPSSDHQYKVDAQLVKDKNYEREQDAARFDEDTRLLREATERNAWDRTSFLEVASDSDTKSKEKCRKTT
eukprot:4330017-Karenia_brevis.AAC.1